MCISIKAQVFYCPPYSNAPTTYRSAAPTGCTTTRASSREIRTTSSTTPSSTTSSARTVSYATNTQAIHNTIHDSIILQQSINK